MAWLHLAGAAQNAAVDAVTALVDAGSSGGVIKIYDGDPPASADTAVSSQTLLAELTFADPNAFGSAASGSATANTITSDTSADASGTASWARIEDASGNVVFDVDVGTSNATIILSTVNIVAGQTIAVSSGTISIASGA